MIFKIASYDPSFCMPGPLLMFSECNVNVWVQVRIQLPEETELPPRDDPNEEEESTEQNDLLDKDTVAVETSDWL